MNNVQFVASSTQVNYLEHGELLIDVFKVLASSSPSFPVETELENLRKCFLKFVFWPAILRQDFEGLNSVLLKVQSYPGMSGYLYLFNAVKVLCLKKGYSLSDVLSNLDNAETSFMNVKHIEGLKVVLEIRTELSSSTALLLN